MKPTVVALGLLKGVCSTERSRGVRGEESGRCNERLPLLIINWLRPEISRDVIVVDFDTFGLSCSLVP
jgi:hypothetical protein